MSEEYGELLDNIAGIRVTLQVHSAMLENINRRLDALEGRPVAPGPEATYRGKPLSALTEENWAKILALGGLP